MVRHLVVAMMAVALLASSLSAQSITVFEDSSFQAVQMALNGLGMAHTYRASDDVAFVGDLNSGTFDLAIINQSAFTNLNDDVDDINNFLLGGGRLIVANFDIDATSGAALWTTMGAQWQSDLGSPVNPIEIRAPLHPVFSGIVDLVPTTGGSDNGDFMSPLANGIDIAGAPGGNALQSLIIVRNDDRTILNSFLPFDYQGDPDIIPLIENQIQFVIPEPTTLTLTALGLLAMCCRRRRQA